MRGLKLWVGVSRPRMMPVSEAGIELHASIHNIEVPIRALPSRDEVKPVVPIHEATSFHILSYFIILYTVNKKLPS